MSNPAVKLLIAVVEPLAEPVVHAITRLVEGALAGESPALLQARAEALATLTGYKAAVGTAAELRREELRRGGR